MRFDLREVARVLVLRFDLTAEIRFGSRVLVMRFDLGKVGRVLVLVFDLELKFDLRPGFGYDIRFESRDPIWS